MKSDVFRFSRLKDSKVALHPNPKGVISFIGGTFFGTFPTIFYRSLLEDIFNCSYTIVAFPYRFTFDHWSAAIGLAEDRYEIQQELTEKAKKLGYGYEIYQENPNSKDSNYIWLGHSLGCKYIGLLELLTDLEKQDFQVDLSACVSQEEAESIIKLLSHISLDKISLFNQPSILIDPVISDLDDAVPFESLRKIVNRFIKVEPSRKQTYGLINKSKLFGLTSIIDLSSQLGEETVKQLKELIASNLSHFKSLPIGKHLAPMGFTRSNSAVVKAVLDAIEKHELNSSCNCVVDNKTSKIFI